jgi:hypothetical protein
MPSDPAPVPSVTPADEASIRQCTQSERGRGGPKDNQCAAAISRFGTDGDRVSEQR